MSAFDRLRTLSGRQPGTDSAFARLIAKFAPARCILASPSPTPAQWAALGLRVPPEDYRPEGYDPTTVQLEMQSQRSFTPKEMLADDQRWPATRQARAAVVAWMLAPPFLGQDSQTRCNRKLTLLKVLDWLEMQPGSTWQERWDATGAGIDGRVD